MQADAGGTLDGKAALLIDCSPLRPVGWADVRPPVVFPRLAEAECIGSAHGLWKTMLTIQVHNYDFHVLDLPLRMPFRYGIATLTTLPHLFVRVELSVNGYRQWGVAAEGLPPKWFTKSLDTTHAQELRELISCIRAAFAFAVEIGASASVFALWRQLREAQEEWRRRAGVAPLCAQLGTSLVERCALDAFCRGGEISFGRALRGNLLGVELGTLHAELAGVRPVHLLPPRSLQRLIVRHTVGLSDPLTDESISPELRLNDGLPQSLEACIQCYGLSHFKIKLCGEPQSDLDRLRDVGAVISRCTQGRFAVTLDGNEQFACVENLEHLWEKMKADASLATMTRRLLFVEQPFPRAIALGDTIAKALARCSSLPPLIIDESDDSVESLPRALECGYQGVAHKNCKGVFKSIGNACLLEQKRRLDPGGVYILSGEDLCTVGPVALLQDLAVLAALGVEHAERNGHHYIGTLSKLPETWQRCLLFQHGDLYREGPDGAPMLDIRHGAVELESVTRAAFGADFEVDPARFTPLDEWDPAAIPGE